MKLQDVLNYFGNQNRTAIQLGISREAVRKWVVKNEVPILRQYQIQELTKGALKVNG